MHPGPAFLARALLALIVAAGAGFALPSCAAPPPAQEQAMTEDEFWSLIAVSAPYEADPERQMEVLAAALDALPPEEIEAFEIEFWKQMARAYTWDLWGATYVIHGGASDDGFEYFRRWLISKGRPVFEAALADPDILADDLAPGPEGVLEFEEFSYVAGDVWARKTGRSRNDFAPESLDYMMPAEPQGTSFDEEDEAAFESKYPRLWRRFGENPLQ